jgi:hypothetical protein
MGHYALFLGCRVAHLGCGVSQKGHKNTNAPLIFENLGYYFFWFWANYIMGYFSGYFEGASTFLIPKLSLAALGTI